jgi:hypothetical protein
MQIVSGQWIIPFPGPPAKGQRARPGRLRQLQPQIDAIEAASGRAAVLEQEVKGKLAKTQKVFHEKIAALEAEFEKRVAGVDQRVPGVESNVADIKRAIEYLGRSFNPRDFRSYVAEQVFSVWKPEFVVLHNSGTPTLKQWRERRERGSSPEAFMRSIATYYGGLGWRGGPHLIIDDRVTWALNPLTKPGTHTASWNNKSFGVTMIGNCTA